MPQPNFAVFQSAMNTACNQAATLLTAKKQLVAEKNTSLVQFIRTQELPFYTDIYTQTKSLLDRLNLANSYKSQKGETNESFSAIINHLKFLIPQLEAVIQSLLKQRDVSDVTFDPFTVAWRGELDALDEIDTYFSKIQRTIPIRTPPKKRFFSRALFVIAALLALQSLTSAQSEPLLLAQRQIADEQATSLNYRGARLITAPALQFASADKKTNITIYATKLEPIGKAPKFDISLSVTTEKTSVRVFDEGADGRTAGDSFVLSHDFSTGDSLHIHIEQMTAKDYAIICTLYFADGNKLSSEIATADQNKLLRYLGFKKAAPIIAWADDIYKGIVAAALNNKSPDVPFSVLQSALNDLEPLLPALAKESDSSVALLALVDKYAKIAEKHL